MLRPGLTSKRSPQPPTSRFHKGILQGMRVEDTHLWLWAEGLEEVLGWIGKTMKRTRRHRNGKGVTKELTQNQGNLSGVHLTHGYTSKQTYQHNNSVYEDLAPKHLPWLGRASLGDMHVALSTSVSNHWHPECLALTACPSM